MGIFRLKPLHNDSNNEPENEKNATAPSSPSVQRLQPKSQKTAASGDSAITPPTESALAHNEASEPSRGNFETPKSRPNTRPSTQTVDPRQQDLFELKTILHTQLIEVLDLEVLVKVEQEVAKKQIERILSDLIRNQSVPVTNDEKNMIIREVVNETFGLGPLEPLLSDGTVDEILVNGCNNVYIERHGKLTKTNIRFKDDTHLRHIINRIVTKIGRRIDEASPMVDARLQDGSRVNAIIPPLALDGPAVSIRKFREMPISAEELVRIGSCTDDILKILETAVKAKVNILVSGGTGTGKTTLLNILSSFIPSDERIVTIEDAAELRLMQPHVVRLETRPSNIEGKGVITQRELVKNSLRMRPDRIVVGEVRGAEAMDMLQAMNTGHDGSITTVHANTARDALSRLETMVLLAAGNLDQRSINKQIVSAIQLIVQIRRFPDGKRRIESLTELVGMEGQTITLQDLVEYVVDGRNPNDGSFIGHFEMKVVQPKFFNRAKDMGVTLPKLQLMGIRK